MSGFTLSDIEDKWMDEMSSDDLTTLSEDFYEDVASYVAELEREIEESTDLRRDLLRRELDHVVDMVQDIHFLRTLKILDSIFEEEGSGLMERERRSFSKIKSEFDDLRGDLVEPILKGESELRPPREKNNRMILISTDIPEKIICADMTVYGPFESGDVANLPKKSADLLVKQGLAKKLEVKEA